MSGERLYKLWVAATAGVTGGIGVIAIVPVIVLVGLWR